MNVLSTDYKLNNVHIFLGDIWFGFSAVLEKGGKNIATVTNTGREMIILMKDEDEQSNMNQIYKELKITDEVFTTLQNCSSRVHSFINDLYDDYLENLTLKRKCKYQTIFRYADSKKGEYEYENIQYCDVAKEYLIERAHDKNKVITEFINERFL